MATTNHHTVNGMILGETTSGTRNDFLTDALGSVTANLDQAGKTINTYRYKPYGTQLAKTGVGADPAFRWVGSHGYKSTGRSHSSQYVRARHYGQEEGRWTTVDCFWPKQSQYAYTSGGVVTTIDPTGLFSLVVDGSCGGLASEIGDTYDSACNEIYKFGKADIQALSECVRKKIGSSCMRKLGDLINSDGIRKLLECLQTTCSPGEVLVVSCDGEGCYKNVKPGDVICAYSECPNGQTQHKLTLCLPESWGCMVGWQPDCDCAGNVYRVPCKEAKNAPPGFCIFVHEMPHSCGLCVPKGDPREHCMEMAAQALACCLTSKSEKPA